MTDFFSEVRERVSAKEVAVFYGLEVDRHGKVRCCFHSPDRHPSMTFKDRRFKCWSCGASGDSIDFTAKLFGLEPLEAVAKINQDFGLNLPLYHRPTIQEEREARKRREVAQAHQKFEQWRKQTATLLDRACYVANQAAKRPSDELTGAEVEAVQYGPYLEYLADTLIDEPGDPPDGAADDLAQAFRDHRRAVYQTQVRIFQERRRLEQWIQQVLKPCCKTA